MKLTGVVAALGALTVASSVIAAPAVAAPRTGCTAAKQVGAAQAYVNAVANGALAGRVPLAPFVLRFQAGTPTSYTAVALRAELATHVQGAFASRPIIVSRMAHPGGELDKARIVYLVPQWAFGKNITTFRTTTTFKIPRKNCLIYEVDEHIKVLKGRDLPETPEAPFTPPPIGES